MNPNHIAGHRPNFTTRNLMLDLEFMSLQPDAAIVQIGAVFFDPFGDPNVEIPSIDKININVALESAIASGGSVDGGTVMWWLEQAASARGALVDPKPVNINVALAQFRTWIVNGMEREAHRTGVPADHEYGPYVWGNGSADDNIKLRTAYDRSQTPLPWSFRHDRCYRTLVSFLDPEWLMRRENRGTHHRAVDDAESQARHMQLVLRASGVRPLSGESDLLPVDTSGVLS